MPKKPTIEEMLKAGMHFGHRTSKWHPKMEPFIFGARGGVHIIDLVKASGYLENALDFMKKFASEGKIILFIGTKAQVKKPLRQVAEEAGMPFITERWMGGTLTNFPVVKRLIKKYQGLLDDKSKGRLEKYTKKERLDFDREIGKLETKVGGLTNLTRLPDAVFVWDIREEKLAVTEARKRNIPIIAVCDTNVDPTPVNYPIPANDDATKSIKLILGLVAKALDEGRKEKGKAKPAPGVKK